MAGALSSQAEGGFLMVEYHKSSAAFSLTAQRSSHQRFLLSQHEEATSSLTAQRFSQLTIPGVPFPNGNQIRHKWQRQTPHGHVWQ